MASSERILQCFPRERLRRRSGSADKRWRRLSRCNPLGTYFCHLHSLVGFECQFNGSHNRCHAHIATDGTNHRNGLSSGIADLKLFKRALTNYLITTVISVVTATIYFTISPITEAQSELLARTSPTLYDVLIALFGGAAGILAISTKSKNNVIPGVAIATALMPPLCTAGYGLAVSNTSYFFGAFYLYFINTVFIAFTTCIGVRLLHFHRKKFVDREKMKRVNYYIAGILLITMIPAGYMTWRIIKQSVIENNIEKFVRDELNNSGTYIISHEYDSKTKTLNVVAIGKPISVGAIAKAQKSMADYKLGDYTLKVIQGASSDSLLAIQRNKKGLAVTGEGNSSKWQE